MKWSIWLLALSSAAALAAAPSLEPLPAGKKPAAKSTDPALVEVADAPGLPRVLLIGDSISMGYTLPVRALLKGRANVHHPPENCGDTARGLRRLEAWLGTNQWAVIHFNFGLHDLKYLDPQGKYVPPDQGKQVAPPPQYTANLRQLVECLRKTGAVLIFGTTTPVPAGSLGRVETDAEVYNDCALQVMAQNSVVINDLFKVVKPAQATLQLPRNVHFTPAGYQALAAAVAAKVTAALPTRSPASP